MTVTVVTNDRTVADEYAAQGRTVRLVQRPRGQASVEWRAPSPKRRHRVDLGPALSVLATRPGHWGVIATLATDGQARSARRAVLDVGGYDAAIRATANGFELFAVATIPPFDKAAS